MDSRNRFIQIFNDTVTVFTKMFHKQTTQKQIFHLKPQIRSFVRECYPQESLSNPISLIKHSILLTQYGKVISLCKGWEPTAILLKVCLAVA